MGQGHPAVIVQRLSRGEELRRRIALWAIAFQKLPAAEKWPPLLVILLFLVNLGNVVAISVVHSMEVQRYSTVQFAGALFAELWAIRYLLGFILGRYRAGRSVRHPRQA